MSVSARDREMREGELGQGTAGGDSGEFPSQPTRFLGPNFTSPCGGKTAGFRLSSERETE